MKLSWWLMLLVVASTIVINSCRKHKEILNTLPDGPGLIPGTDSVPRTDSIPPTDSIPSDTMINKPEDTVHYSMVPKNIDITSNVGGFYEALPYDYDSTQSTYPLLVFLHGGGEVGNGKDELRFVLKNGLAERMDNRSFPGYFTSEGAKYSFVALFPQFKKWPAPSDVQAVINYALANYRVDEHRIYLAGMSMGGGATWDYAKEFGSRLAAIVTICGASVPDSVGARKIADANVPAWAFHNADDPTVPVSNTELYAQWINSMNSAEPVHTTIWPEGGHGAWTKATDPEYREDGKNMYEWMLQYSR